MILTSDQYAAYRSERESLFGRLKTWGSEFPIIFAGYSLQDKDLRMILNELDAEQREGRPRYYLVGPSFKPEQISNWERRKITAIIATFEEFVKGLDVGIGSVFRGVIPSNNSSPSGYIQRSLAPGEELSERAKMFLEVDVEVVNDIRSTQFVEPRDFYHALNNGWGAIEANLDVRRRVTDTILETHIFEKETSEKAAEFVVIKGHAGSGKSVFIRRIAWEISREFDMPCLYLRELGELMPVAVVEIARRLKQRVVLFVDDILRVHRELSSLLESATDAGVQVLVFGTVRQNEFNTRTFEITQLVDDDYELGYLSEKEVGLLLTSLESHNCLGELARLTPDERFQAFNDHSGRQLLVALHEATHAETFRNIVANEFHRIRPETAKQIYKTICVLYRLKTPVRAGLISRIHGVGFKDFSLKFMGPLEKIVRVIDGENGRDYSYVARHSQIADFVFHDAIIDAADRLEHW